MTIDVDVSHRLGDFNLDVKFAAANGAIALFGRSGAGKTSVVQIVAGLIKPRRGKVTVDGRALLDTAHHIDVPPHLRRVGYIFQDGRLFTHLTVRQNLLYGSWFARKRADRSSLGQAVELLNLSKLLHRYPRHLSGGEKQRVAIGRALLAAPDLLLMDEPLSSLDEERKAEVLPFLRALKREARIPIIFVTHALAEVRALADTVIHLSSGHVEIAGAAADVIPQLEFMQAASGASERFFISAEVMAHDAGQALTILRSGAGQWRVAGLVAPPRSEVQLMIDPTDVMIAVEPLRGVSALNVFPGIVTHVTCDAAAAHVDIDCGGDRMASRITRFSAAALNIGAGTPIFAAIKAVAVRRRM